MPHEEKARSSIHTNSAFELKNRLKRLHIKGMADVHVESPYIESLEGNTYTHSAYRASVLIQRSWRLEKAKIPEKLAKYKQQRKLLMQGDQQDDTICDFNNEEGEEEVGYDFTDANARQFAEACMNNRQFEETNTMSYVDTYINNNNNDRSSSPSAEAKYRYDDERKDNEGPENASNTGSRPGIKYQKFPTRNGSGMDFSSLPSN